MGLMHLLNLFKYTIELNKGEITFSEFRELSNLHYTDFIYSKNHVSSYLFRLSPIAISPCFCSIPRSFAIKSTSYTTKPLSRAGNLTAAVREPELSRDRNRESGKINIE
jgi:hypothetical protein